MSLGTTLQNGASWVLNVLYGLVEEHHLRLGPLTLTTEARISKAEINAFDLGRDVGAVSGPEPKPARVRHLHTV